MLSIQSHRVRIALLLAAIVCGVFVVLCIGWFKGRGGSQREAVPGGPVDLAAVQRGEYLARIGNCFSCHTSREGEPFAGGVPFAAPYASLGTLYSTNITPDSVSGIGNWTEEQFVRALHRGEGPEGQRYFPAFPYTSFTQIAVDDAKAIYAYLRTIKPVRYKPPSNSFVFNRRWAMRVWNALFFEGVRFVADPSQTQQWNRGAYLVNGLGHCGACHTPRNIFLAEKKRAALSGSAYPEVIAPGQSRTWFAVNLTAAASGLGAWSVSDIKQYLKTGHSRRAGLFGPMNEVVINSLQYLTDEDAQAMAVYLKSLPALNESTTSPIDEQRMKSGAAVYEQHCEECHRSSGRGAFLKAPPVVGSAVVQGRHPSTLINVILYGAKAGVGAPEPFGAWEGMPGFADKLTDMQVAVLASYLRGHWGNRGSQVAAEEVARQR